MKFKLTLQRKFSQLRDQNSGLDFIKSGATGKRSRWKVIFTKLEEPEFVPADNKYVYTCNLTFQKDGGKLDPKVLKREWLGIVSAVEKQGQAARFMPYPWTVESQEIPEVVEAIVTEEPVAGGSFIQSRDSQVHHAMDSNTGVTLDEVKERSLPLINELLHSEKKLTNNEHFQGIFGRNPQIRSILSSVKSFLDSNGKRRNHVLLYGLPACAKTQILNSVADLLGQDAIVRLDGTSTTPAGIYKTYFTELADIPAPPFVILEEAEKTSEESLRVWFGALDDRGELRKVNAREMLVRQIDILCLATANDKDEFDRLMGGTANRPGALSSRFVHQLHCPRPDRKVLKMILERDVNANGGNLDWVEPALELSVELDTDDPRKVLGFLDGGDRLLSGAYQKDILAIFNARKAEKKLAAVA